jgi:uncharacterized protein (UPF0332 family)
LSAILTRSVSLRGGHTSTGSVRRLLFPTRCPEPVEGKQSPAIRRLLRLSTRAPRSDVFILRIAAFEYSYYIHLSYTFIMDDPKDNYRLYMKNAQEMLDVAGENLRNDHYNSACNCAYYGIFYAASALLYSKGKSYGKHSAVLVAFRQYFIKTGELDKKWSDDYKIIMESRHTADYELYDSLEKEAVVIVVAKAHEFVEEVKKWLQKRDLL